MKLSASRLQCYRTCPRQYRYRYVDGLPTVVTGPLVFGKTVHAALCHLHQTAMSTGAPLHLADALEAFESLWREALIRDAPAFTSEGDIVGYEALAGDILAGYVDAHRDAPPPLAVEFEFELPWQDHLLHGFIDRLDETESGLVVVDYKSGKRKPDPMALREDVQLTLYGFVAEQVFGQPVERLVCYHLRDQTPLVTRRDPVEYRRFASGVLLPTAEAIEAGRFPPRRGWWCRFCDFAAACETEGPEGPVLASVPLELPKGETAWPT